MIKSHPVSRASVEYRIGAIRRFINALNDLSGILTRVSFPVVDLVLRLWIGGTFVSSGILEWADLDAGTNSFSVVTGAGEPVEIAALYVTAAIEVLGGLFLVLGLGARFAAALLVTVALWLHSQHPGLGIEPTLLVLSGWFIVAGAGPISFDHFVGQGLQESALFLAKPVAVFCSVVTLWIAPLYLLGFRIIVSATFFSSVLGNAEGAASAFYVFLSDHQAVSELPAAAASAITLSGLIFAAFMAVGLATRISAFPLFLTALLLDVIFFEDTSHLLLAAMLGLLIARGPGRLSADHLLWQFLCGRYPELAGKPPFPLHKLPHVIVVGAGFGGISAVRALRYTPCRVTLIDRHNYHLFQPLLYQVATGGLSPADIATPIRSLLRQQANVTVLMGRVQQIDKEADAVILGSGRRIDFDFLILATGVRHGYFGRDDDWEDLAPGLKKLEDATELRRRLLLAFEKAESIEDAELRRQFLTFVIVGGGPTGVELAGAVAELARHGLRGEFRNIDPAGARIILVQADDRILPSFPEELSRKAARSLERLGVELRLKSTVEDIDENGVMIAGERIEAKTVFWAAGVIASPAGKWLGAETDPAGRVKVEADLSIPGRPNVFAVGDTAASSGWNGKAVPGLAPAAKQGGKHAARVVHATLEGRPHPGPFVYKHAGSLATIGRKAAVADLNVFHFSGALAWWFWGLVHVFSLTGARNRIAVVIKWAWAYVTYRGGMRLITGQMD